MKTMRFYHGLPAIILIITTSTTDFTTVLKPIKFEIHVIPVALFPLEI